MFIVRGEHNKGNGTENLANILQQYILEINDSFSGI